jgi:competence protein ComEC
MSDVSGSWRRVRCAPLAPLAFAVSGGIVVDRYVEPFSTFGWALFALGAAVLAVLTWRFRWVCSAMIVLAFGALGAGWHQARWSDLAPDDLALADWGSSGRRPCWVRGVTVEVPTFRKGDGSPGDRGFTRTALALTAVHDGGVWRAASGKIQTTIVGDRSDLEVGRAVEAAGSISGVDGPLNPGEFDFRPFLRSQGIRLKLSVDEPSSVWPDSTGQDWPWPRRLGAIRDWSHKRLTLTVDPSVAPLASALLLGRRESVDPDVNDAFARTGTTHLLAISGLQLQVLAVFVGSFLRGLGLGRKRTFLVVGILTAAYAMLVGLAPSVVRSAAMTVGACLAGGRDRCVGPANLMSGAILATLLLDPADLFDIGCQLSFLAVAAILWLVPAILEWDAPRLEPLDELERKFEPWWQVKARMGLAGLRAGVIGSAVIWVVAWPLVSSKFHIVSPIGILMNIPLIPLTSIALLLSGVTLLLAMVWTPLAWPFAWACGQCLNWTEVIVRWGKDFRPGHAFVAGPDWVWVVGFYGLLGMASLTMVCRWRSSRAWWSLTIVCGFVIAALPMIPNRPETTEADVLAVGHGLAVIVRSAEGKTALYDCGKLGDPHVGRRVIAPALWTRGVRKIDVLILSHADSDHFNGLPDLLDRFEVGVVRLPPGFDSPSNPAARKLVESIRSLGIPIEPIADGMTIDLGAGTTLTAIHPLSTASPELSDNARSVVLEVASNGRRLLLTGDLENSGLSQVTARPIEPLDAMLAPHHGGRTSNPAWLYAWAKPSLVVSSQRPPNSGSKDPLDAIVHGQFPLLKTWERGAIRIRWTSDGLVANGFLDSAEASPKAVAAAVWLPRVDINKVVAVLLGLILGASLCLAVTVVEWGAWSLVMPGRKRPKPLPDDLAGEMIHTQATDGTRLAGVWFRNEASEGRTILLLHGLAEDHSALLGRVAPLLRLGWNVATLDARASGESNGRRSSFGARESADLIAWIDTWKVQAGPSPRFAVWGRSMGASTALKAAAADPRIQALILEAPYRNLHPAVASVLKRLRIPLADLFARMILFRARVLAGISLDQPRPTDLAPLVDIPVLILHGELDPIAPIADARALAESFARPAEILEVIGASHANVVGIGGDGLMDRVGSFLETALPREIS